jgi:hypothetical protein
MGWIVRWVFRTAVLWAAGKAWQAYQEKKARDRGQSPFR